MVGMSPNRPGFTTGKEEEIWSGTPAIRSTIYYWIFSLVGGLIIFYVFGKLMTGLLSAGAFSAIPGAAVALFTPTGDLKGWVRALPLFVCLFPAFWYTLGLILTSYKLTTQRLHVRTGILIRTYDQLELFRVRDFLIDAPLYMVILGLGHVRVISRDESLPLLTLIAQPASDKLIDMIRDNVQRRKDEVGMREIETNTQ